MATITIILTIATGILLLIYLYTKYILYTYWTRHGIYQFPQTFPLGYARPLFFEKKTMADFFRDIYLKMRTNNLKFAGFYLITRRQLMITDPEHVKHVLTTDFSHFRDRLGWSHEQIDPLSLSLLSLPADRWKRIRSKTSPFFTPNKMKAIFPLMENCGEKLLKVTEKLADEDVPFNCKELIWSFTCTVLGSCVFGYDCDALTNDANIAKLVGKDIFEPHYLRSLVRPLMFLMPDVLRVCRISTNSQFVTNFFLNLVKDSIELRKDNKYYRSDLMQMLVDARIKEGSTDGLSINEIAAQCWVFFAGGFDTAAIFGSFCLYELSRNEKVQNKLRQEINEVLKKHNGKFSFESVQEMKYMEKVMKETLRMYPPLPFLNRICTKEFTFPNSEVTVRPGDGIVISAYGIQRDPEYYPNPDLFNPDRFDETNDSVVPYTYLPFGEGPRNCIGLRMGYIQGMYTIALLVKHFHFKFNEKTKLPFKMAKNTFTMSVEGGIWLDVEKVN